MIFAVLIDSWNVHNFEQCVDRLALWYWTKITFKKIDFIRVGKPSTEQWRIWARGRRRVDAPPLENCHPIIARIGNGPLTLYKYYYYRLVITVVNSYYFLYLIIVVLQIIAVDLTRFCWTISFYLVTIYNICNILLYTIYRHRRN